MMTTAGNPVENELVQDESALSQIDLMNPSGMLGMTQGGRPGMTGAEPQDMFSVNNEQSSVLGWTSSNGMNGGPHSPSHINPNNGKMWFGTGSPGEGLLR